MNIFLDDNNDLFFNEQLDILFEAKLNNNILQTQLFGTLKLDRKYNCFECEYEYNNKKIILAIHNSIDVEKTVSKLESIIKNFKFYDEKMRFFATKKLISLVGEWGSKNITEKDLYSSMFPKWINMYSINNYEFGYSDGGIFGGHSILIRCNSKGPVKVTLAG